jgi:hypothetical protein
MKTIFERIDEMEQKIMAINAPLQEADPDFIDSDAEGEYENKLTPELLERFVDGLLIVLGEVEMEGQIPQIESANQARDALLAVVRRLYMKKSLVAKMSRKFARFGAKRFLRKQQTVIRKASSQ